MGYELRDMSGSLFRNDRKSNGKSPDYQGTVMINGVEMWINGWLKEGNNGRFFSLAFKPKEQQQSKPQRQEPARQTKANFHDDLEGDEIPFTSEWR